LGRKLIDLQQFNYSTKSPFFSKICHSIEKERCSPQHVVTVEMNVKYHSNQKTTDLFIAENVSKTTNQHQDLVVDLEEDLAGSVETEVQDLVEETIDHERCSPQHVVTVEMNVKYHSNQKTTDLFIAENVSKTIDKIRIFFLKNSSLILYFP
jgi:t-SNARE complex subunit (syntaxin)